MKRHYVLTILAALAFSAFTGSALAAQPCGKAVIDDWYDNGTLDEPWDCDCLRDAIDWLPDIRAPYSSAQDDFQRQIELKLCEGSTQQVLRATVTGPTGATDAQDSGDRWWSQLAVALAIATAAVAWWAMWRRRREA